MGDWGIPREPINPLCSPPEQCHGQQSHTSWRLSHRRLQTLCSLRCHSAPSQTQEPHVATFGDEVKSEIGPFGFTCRIVLKESGKLCVITV